MTRIARHITPADAGTNSQEILQCHSPGDFFMSYVKIGVAGPVGSGKTALIEALSRKMAGDYSIGVITNESCCKDKEPDQIKKAEKS